MSTSLVLTGTSEQIKSPRALKVRCNCTLRVTGRNECTDRNDDDGDGDGDMMMLHERTNEPSIERESTHQSM